MMALFFFSMLTLGDVPAPPPPTAKLPASDTYHGVKVTEEYRWLENFDSSNVKAWSDSQNRRTRNWLESLPSRDYLIGRFKKLYGARQVRYGGLTKRGDLFFAQKFQPPKNQPLLVVLRSPEDLTTEKTLLDLNLLNPKGTTAMDWFVPSLDGKMVAVCLSEMGSEDGSVAIYETATGKRLSDLVPRVNFPTAGGSVAWNEEGTGFYYTRYPQGSERAKEDLNFYQQVYFHKLGTPATQDTYVLGKDFPRIAEIELHTTPEGRYLLAEVKNGDGGEVAHYLRSPGGAWKQVTRFEDNVKEIVFGKDEALYLVSRKDAPKGKVQRLPLSSPELASAKTVIPEGEGVLEGLLPTATRLYVTVMSGGPTELKIYTLDGKPSGTVPAPPIASTSSILTLQDDTILYGSTSFVEPYTIYKFNPADNKPVKLPLTPKAEVDFSDIEVVREFATSKDGTKVPLNILKRKGTKLNGSNPTLLTAYGGYGISLSPGFDVGVRVWLEHGGVYVVANLRGGGEFGEAWHLSGNLTKKQNVFDDFLASAEYLIQQKYTRPERLAIEGGSNGGLLMGAALTQRPDLFRAVVSHVGIYDMLRVELTPNGAFNVTEFGTVKDPEQFKALYAYSPYHQVKDGTDYPAVLFLTGDNDGRVDPANSRKMTARLQAANHSGRPILLRTNAEGGHGQGTSLSEQIVEAADVHAFLFDQLKIDHHIKKKE